jgi:uncharacterized membrane protein YbjE (DUF340 family)
VAEVNAAAFIFHHASDPMSQLVLILSLIGALAAGILAGRIRAVGALRESRAFTAIRSGILFLLVFTMGFRIGRTDEVLDSIASVGLVALGFSLATMGGTFLVLIFLFSLRLRPTGFGSAWGEILPAQSPPGNGPSSPVRLFKDPLTFLLILIAGFFCGLFLPLFPRLDGSKLITAVLYLLLVIVGVGLGAGEARFRQIVTHPYLFLIPLGTAAGSLLGGLAIGLLLHLRAGTSLALSSGFGWYSLSGVILTRLDGPFTGSIAFLSNMLRESMALILIPLLSRTRYPLLAVGAGGATSMDVTLFVTCRYVGKDAAPFCVVSGGVLSLLVPILVPVFHGLV